METREKWFFLTKQKLIHKETFIISNFFGQSVESFLPLRILRAEYEQCWSLKDIFTNQAR